MRPLVAIVGRPNVGKSSLFNRLVGQPIAIVDPTPGTTRDRLLHPVRRDGVRFDLIDTGGIGIVDAAKLEKDIYLQVQRAIDTADAIVFLVDGRDGILPLDREVAKTLRPIKQRVILAVNKLDHGGIEHERFQFEALGLGEPLALSAAQATGIHDLLDHLVQRVPSLKDDATPDEADDGRTRLALVGRRNVGKSSLTNALCGDQRVIVADLPGTTRDAIDVPIDRPFGAYTLIDTAGLRKRGQIVEEDLEFYSACRTERAIRRCHVTLMVIDAAEEIGNVDRRLARFCAVEGKPTILVVNKWDIAEQRGASKAKYREWLADRLPDLDYAPVVFTCALTGLNTDELLQMADEMRAETCQRLTTSQLNDILEAAIKLKRPRKTGPSPTRLYFITQAETEPPTLIAFVNRTDWMEANYSRFLERFIRERSPFPRVPIRLLFKSRDSKFHDSEDAHEVVNARTKAERNATLVLPFELANLKRRADRRRRGDAREQGKEDRRTAESASEADGD